MPIQQRLRPSTEFSLASISDIVFLLLIFFMLTSSFVNQTGVKVELPQGTSSRPTTAPSAVTITTEGEYYWNNQKIQRQEVRGFIQQAFAGQEKKVLTLRTDKEVTMQDAAYVISLVAEQGGAVTIATRKD